MSALMPSDRVRKTPGAQIECNPAVRESGAHVTEDAAGGLNSHPSPATKMLLVATGELKS